MKRSLIISLSILLLFSGCTFRSSVENEVRKMQENAKELHETSQKESGQRVDCEVLFNGLLIRKNTDPVYQGTVVIRHLEDRNFFLTHFLGEALYDSHIRKNHDHRF